MATRVSNSLHNYTLTDAEFRANCQFIEDTLVTTGGWLVTTDTGQSLPSTISHPTGNGQKMGYRIYTMNDTLQATRPVFVRIDYGSGSTNGQPFGIWVTIGMGSDGAGNIVNRLSPLQLPVYYGTNSANNTTPTNCYGSAAPNRVSLGMFVNSSVNFIWVFTLGRTKDATGADTGEGLIMLYNEGSFAGLAGSLYMIYGLATQPPPELGLNYILTAQNPSQSFGGDIGVGVVSHFKGVAQQPGLNVLVCNSADIAPEGSFSITIYGALHTYQHMNILVPEKGYSNSHTTDNSARVCIRFD